MTIVSRMQCPGRTAPSDVDVAGMVSAIEAWLESIGHGQYAELFERHAIDADVLSELNEDDLRELEIPLGHRKKLLVAIAKLEQQNDTSFPDLGAQNEPVHAEGERRQVTVLFADISKFTQLSSTLGAEATHGLLNRYFAAVDRVVQNYGGSIDKHIGDNVMAVFGAPIAHDNDPERAARTALDIHQAVDQVGRKLSVALEAHVGIASGDVVASGTGSDAHREYTVTGEAVNLAARLEALAEAEQTLVSDTVWQALGGKATGHSLGEHDVKGFAEPVLVWDLQALSEYRQLTSQSPLVGRHAELRQFEAILDACLKDDTGHTVYLRGDAGIGKTRLAEAFQAIAEERGCICHTGLVLDFGASSSRNAIGTLAHDLIGLSPDVDEAERSSAIDKAITSGFIDPDRRVFLNELLGQAQARDLRVIYDAMDSATRAQRERETLVQLITRLSDTHALCLRIEDLHWADDSALDHLASLMRSIAAHRIILILTSRFENDPMDGSWRSVTRGCPITTLDVGRLHDRDARALIGERSTLDDDFFGACIELAEGNPLFLEQLLRNADAVRKAELPGSLQSVILARADRLGRQDKQALQAASVIGQRFELDVLRKKIARTASKKRRRFMRKSTSNSRSLRSSARKAFAPKSVIKC